MFAKRADAVISCVSGQDMHKPWQKGHKMGFTQRPSAQIKTSGESSAQGTGGPEPMELGMARQRTLSWEEYQKLRSENVYVICRKPGHIAQNCSMKKKNSGNGMGC